MNFARIFAIANNVFSEVIRDRVLYLIGLFVLFLAGIIRLLPELAAQTHNKMIVDIGIAAIGILGLIVTAFVGTGLINKEIERRTVLVLLSKPIGRAELIVGKHLGLSGVLAVLISSTTLFYFILLAINDIRFPFGSLLVAMLYLFLELSLLTAVAILFGVLTSSLLATLLTFGIYVIGHLSADILKAGELSQSPSLEAITKGIYFIIPNLSRLDLKNDAVYGVLPDLMTLLLNAGYALIYIVLLLAIANLIFARREF
ncbi:ABC transporter permease [Oxynema aestuarii]|uniref:ABC transporter permease n=1 Tax=Oxynema aestuarii AP17 TaxID=2064643 RepID=A0A6H1U140_9CYAN|nr:ABC transporter permease subunit [Oxynema aestuarii]QIZ72551.1 ABC transporter permease [Oxynema aestuarii AP17]RMH72672.1 MAG: ABC transporter permease [Cyanobacteria bacterium J007]